MTRKSKGNLDSGQDFPDSFDDGFGDMNFDFGADGAKDDRHPVLRTALGALDGIGDTLTGAEFVRRAIRQTFPSGYGEALDLADRVSRSAKDLYDESVRAIRPSLKQAQSSILKIMPHESTLVPDFAKKKLEEWRKEEQAAQASQNEVKEESEEVRTAREIFETEQKLKAKERAEEKADRALDRGIAISHHRDLFGQLAAIGVGTKRLVAYQETVNVKWQRKMMELSFRQLGETKRQTDRKSTRLNSSHT